MMKRLAAMLLLGSAVAAQDDRRPPEPGVVKPYAGDRIAWYSTWDLAKAEAERLGRPILLVSAAPHCHTISGIW
jgi:hypothetical protein